MSQIEQSHIGALLGKPSAEDLAVLKTLGKIKVAGKPFDTDLSNSVVPLFTKVKVSTEERG